MYEEDGLFYYYDNINPQNKQTPSYSSINEESTRIFQNNGKNNSIFLSYISQNSTDYKNYDESNFTSPLDKSSPSYTRYNLVQPKNFKLEEEEFNQGGKHSNHSHPNSSIDLFIPNCFDKIGTNKYQFKLEKYLKTIETRIKSSFGGSTRLILLYILHILLYNASIIHSKRLPKLDNIFHHHSDYLITKLKTHTSLRDIVYESLNFFDSNLYFNPNPLFEIPSTTFVITYDYTQFKNSNKSQIGLSSYSSSSSSSYSNSDDTILNLIYSKICDPKPNFVSLSDPVTDEFCFVHFPIELTFSNPTNPSLQQVNWWKSPSNKSNRKVVINYDYNNKQYAPPSHLIDNIIIENNLKHEYSTLFPSCPLFFLINTHSNPIDHFLLNKSSNTNSSTIYELLLRFKSIYKIEKISICTAVVSAFIQPTTN
jgi:hypothetical protein